MSHYSSYRRPKGPSLLAQGGLAALIVFVLACYIFLLVQMIQAWSGERWTEAIFYAIALNSAAGYAVNRK